MRSQTKKKKRSTQWNITSDECTRKKNPFEIKYFMHKYYILHDVFADKLFHSHTILNGWFFFLFWFVRSFAHSNSMFGIYHWIVIIFFFCHSVALQRDRHSPMPWYSLSFIFSIQAKMHFSHCSATSLALLLISFSFCLFHALVLLFFISSMAINKWNVSLAIFSSCVYIPKTHIIIIIIIFCKFFFS